MTHTTLRRTRLARLAILATTLALALVGLVAAAQPAYAAITYDSIDFAGAPYEGNYGLCGLPGDKLVLRATLRGYNDETNTTVVPKSSKITYKWTMNSKLKAKTDGRVCTITKLPKAGNYYSRVRAYNKAGKLLYSKKFKIEVRKKPAIKVVMRVRGASGAFGDANVSKAKANVEVMLNLKGASFGWNNNTKRAYKGFYTWKITQLGTGKVAKWNKANGQFYKNDFVNGGSVAGGDSPFFMGTFTQKGTYKIEGTIYHNNEKLAVASKTITVS